MWILDISFYDSIIHTVNSQKNTLACWVLPYRTDLNSLLLILSLFGDPNKPSQGNMLTLITQLIMFLLLTSVLSPLYHLFLLLYHAVKTVVSGSIAQMVGRLMSNSMLKLIKTLYTKLLLK